MLWVLLGAVLLVAGLPLTGGASPGDGCGTDLAPEVADSAGGWPLPNRDLANQRAQFDTPIHSSTIDQLERVWTYDVPGNALFGNMTTNPVVIDDTVFVGGLDGSIHAMGLDDGTARWSVARSVSIFGPAGVAVGWGKVFGISGSSTAVAHDADTGAVLWQRNLGVRTGNQINVQPTLVGRCVLVATSALAPGSRGTLFALDEATGAVVWSFETVPDDFWGDPSINHGGGSWYPPAVDPASGRVYWGTSNPWPAPGAPGYPVGASRPGDNLYTNTALALDLVDGNLAWHNQAIPHDIWDRDMVLTQVVETVAGDPVVVHTGKGGIVLGLDPATGAERWRTPVGMHLNDDVTDFTGSITVMPGILGGVETPPAAADGVVYVAVMNAPTTYTSPEQTFNLNPQLGSFPSDLVALDAGTGAVLFEVPIPGDSLGGVTVAGDLLLTSTFQGLLLAYDRFTGAEVWRHDAGRFVNGWPAVVGDTILWPISGGGVSQLWAFRLPEGVVPPTTTTTTIPSPSPTTAPSPTTPGPDGPSPTTGPPATAADGGPTSPPAFGGRPLPPTDLAPTPVAPPAAAVAATPAFVG
jgi:outer membrane protein assembly factor BamB